jgi:hypothetical protein
VDKPDADKPALGFIALKSLKHGAPDPAAAVDEIRGIYFKTSRQTIDADMAHAIELLKSIPDEAMREKATVFMHGLSEMQREWEAKKKRTKSGTGRRSGNVKK